MAKSRGIPDASALDVQFRRNINRHLPTQVLFRLERELQSAVEKIAHLLKNGGTAYISLLLGESGYGDPTNSGNLRFFTRMSKEGIFDLFSSHFKIMEESYYDSKFMNEKFIILALKKKI